MKDLSIKNGLNYKPKNEFIKQANKDRHCMSELERARVLDASTKENENTNRITAFFRKSSASNHHKTKVLAVPKKHRMWHLR